MDLLQNLIHKLEVGGGMRYFRTVLVVLAVIAFAVGYNWRAYRNLASQEGMDTAQLARNLAQGKGYSTQFIRPLSIYLVKKRYAAKYGLPAPGERPDQARIKSRHPDLANPPVYPVVLAGLFKLLNPDYVVHDATNPKAFWTSNGRFMRHPPDFYIALFNQALFLAVVVLVYLLARRLFDKNVAWLSAILVLGTELLWRFTVSGISTIFLLLLFTGLAWSLVLLEEETREPRRGPAALFGLAAFAGALVGVGELTRYSFGWLILPVLFFLALVAGRQRWTLMLAALGAFAVVMVPWLVRSYAISGMPFGTASFAILEGSGSAGAFLNHELQRSLEPNFDRRLFRPVLEKLLVNLRVLVQDDLPRLGGSWVSAFFLVGLMVSFTSSAVRRLRHFLVASLVALALVQALGKTQISEDSPEVNTENLLVLLLPLVLVYGASLFFVLLDQIEFAFRELRYVLLAGFCGVACLPLLGVFLPPRTSPVAYPPYHPPLIQNMFSVINQDELMMSDIPWAVAWYGNRQCAWLTLNCQSEFFALHDFVKPVHALYLSRVTMDGRFLTVWQPTEDQSWGNLILQVVRPRNPLERLAELTLAAPPRRFLNPAELRPEDALGPAADKNNMPATFPLRYFPRSYPEQFIMLDWDRRRRE